MRAKSCIIATRMKLSLRVLNSAEHLTPININYSLVLGQQKFFFFSSLENPRRGMNARQDRSERSFTRHDAIRCFGGILLCATRQETAHGFLQLFFSCRYGKLAPTIGPASGEVEILIY